jgi:Mn-dependent DtxR family transcriptional regulator
MGIVVIDMHIRDERVLKWIQSQHAPSLKISAVVVADHFKCHQNTAQAILRRLRQADYIELTERNYRGGHTYRVKRV